MTIGNARRGDLRAILGENTIFFFTFQMGKEWFYPSWPKGQKLKKVVQVVHLSQKVITLFYTLIAFLREEHRGIFSLDYLSQAKHNYYPQTAAVINQTLRIIVLDYPDNDDSCCYKY